MINHYRFRTACCLSFALVPLVLAACGGATTAPTGAGAPPATGHAATRTVVDAAGRTVTIPSQVTRVGTNITYANEMIYLLGGINKLVATDDYSAAHLPFFDAIYPPFKNIPQPFGALTPTVNPEQLLSTHPQVVFLQGQGLLPQLTNIGLPVVVLPYFTTPQQLQACVTLIAEVLGGPAPAQAQRFATFYNQAVAQATGPTASIPTANRPTAYYTGGDPLQTAGAGSIVTTWMNEGGARNVAADTGPSGPFTTVTLEQVLGWNPDYIICRDASTKPQILNDPRWQAIAAVRNHHVIVNPGGVFVWSASSAESALQPLWAAQTFHPDLFPHLDMRQVVRDFYQQFYNFTPSDQQVTQTLQPNQR